MAQVGTDAAGTNSNMLKKDLVSDDEFLQRNHVSKLHPKDTNPEKTTEKQDTPDITFQPELYGEKVEDCIPSSRMGHVFSMESEGNSIPDSHIDPRLSGKDLQNGTRDSSTGLVLHVGSNSAAETDTLNHRGIQKDGPLTETYDLAPGTPLYKLAECLEKANERREPQNIKTECPTTRCTSSSAISISSTSLSVSSPGNSGPWQSSPTSVAYSPLKKRTESSSKRDLTLVPTNDNPDWDELPVGGSHALAQTFHPRARKAPEGNLVDVGLVLVVQKIKDSGVEVPILYTIYQPIQDWLQFRYTMCGDLHHHITFDEETLHDFIYSKPPSFAKSHSL